MARKRTASLWTLLLEDRGARLLDAQGQVVELLPPLDVGGDSWRLWMERLQPRLQGARLQLILGQGSLTCQEVPFLALKEQQEVATRLGAADMGGTDFQAGSTLLADPGADGGHVLWVASVPKGDVRTWIQLAQGLGADLEWAIPLPYLMGRLLADAAPTQRDRLLVSLEAEGGRMLFFRGEALVLSRTFRLPEGVDPAALHSEDEALLLEVLSEELNRVLQFIKQKHRGVALEVLHALGLPAIDPTQQTALERTLRLKLERMEGDGLQAQLLEALGAERRRKGGFNLVPEEVLEARRIRWLRAAAWGAAAVVVLLCIGIWGVLRALEHLKQQDLERARVQRDQRRALHEARDRALRERFPVVRVRAAEARAAQATEALERLSVRLLEVPKGIVLSRVEVAQQPGDALAWRFTVVGTALSGDAFSVGPLATYLASLRQHPGLQLGPLGEVQVSDRRFADGGERLDQRAVTRFTLQGVSP